MKPTIFGIGYPYKNMDGEIIAVRWVTAKKDAEFASALYKVLCLQYREKHFFEVPKNDVKKITQGVLNTLPSSARAHIDSFNLLNVDPLKKCTLQRITDGYCVIFFENQEKILSEDLELDVPTIFFKLFISAGKKLSLFDELADCTVIPIRIDVLEQLVYTFDGKVFSKKDFTALFQKGYVLPVHVVQMTPPSSWYGI